MARELKIEGIEPKGHSLSPCMRCSAYHPVTVNCFNVVEKCIKCSRVLFVDTTNYILGKGVPIGPLCKKHFTLINMDQKADNIKGGVKDST